MTRTPDKDEELGTWLILISCWVLLFWPLFAEVTSRASGARVLAGLSCGLGFLVIGWRWGLNQLMLSEWLLLPTAIAFLFTIDRADPVQLSGVALVMLITPIVRAAIRRGSGSP